MSTLTKFLLSLDPAFLGLRTALRGTLGVVITFLVTSKLSPVLGFLGGIIAMLSGILINDATREAQKKTLLLIIPVSIVSMIPSILLAPYHYLQLACFLFVTFMAVYVRKFGMRWLTLGFISFMSYFSPLFFPIHSALIPEVILTICFAVGLLYVMRFHLLPDHAEKVLKNYLKAFQLQYDSIGRDLKKGKKVSFQKLNELTLAIEGFIGQNSGFKNDELQSALFEREMELQFDKKTDHSPIQIDSLKETAVKENISSPRTVIAGQGLELTTKMAIQATIATAAASMIGMMISPVRWYWAPMTTFIVFVGSTRGETLLRASLRVLGTILGLFFGLLIHPFITGHASLEWGLILTCIFMGIFGMRFYFGFWTASIFSVMITILFDVMGFMNVEILVIRFEETLAGAFLGALSSAIVLPLSTKKVAQKSLARFLLSQANVLDLLPLDKESRAAKKDLVKAIRKMDGELAALKVSFAPFIGKISFMKRGNMPEIIHDIIALGHFTRQLATSKGEVKSGLVELRARTRSVALDLEEKEAEINKVPARLKEILSFYKT